MMQLESITKTRPVDVVLYAEGTYPFRVGGVSSVIHGIISSLPGIQFGVIHLHWGDRPGRSCFKNLPNHIWTFPLRVADFPSAGRKLREIKFPRAAVHHAHTCGLAGLAAATARRQQPGSRMILSEHSLYARDVLAQLDRGHQGWSPMPGSNEMPPVPPGDSCDLRATILEAARHMYDHADVVTYLHRGLLEDAVAFGLDPAKATILPNAIDIEAFRMTRKPRNRATTWHIAIIGRIVPVKGILEGIDCADMLRKAGLDFRMSIIGPDDEVPCYAEACRQKVLDLGLQDIIQFKVTAPATEALRDVDLLLLPSQQEAMPMVVLESMAAGVPVIATDTGNVARLLGDRDEYQAGFVIKVDCMASAIMKLLADTGRYHAMRENGPHRAARNFDARARARHWLELYSI